MKTNMSSSEDSITNSIKPVSYTHLSADLIYYTHHLFVVEWSLLIQYSVYPIYP